MTVLLQPLQLILRQLQAGDVVLALVLALFGVWCVRWLGRRLTGGQSRAASTWEQAAWQLGTVLGLEQVYEFMRGEIPHETDIAMMNAYRLLDFEWSHGFFVEGRIERFFLPFTGVMNLADVFYVAAHVLMTVGVLVWVLLRHRDQFGFVRNMLLITTGIALVVFYLY